MRTSSLRHRRPLWAVSVALVATASLIGGPVAAHGARLPAVAPTAGAAAAGTALAGDLDFEVVRLAGANRYLTAVAVSKRFFSSGVPVAYVTTADTFQDAMAAGPAASKLGGPVLFTLRDSLPGSTRTELDRLNPGRIVVVGSTSAVSSAVRSELATLSPGGATRIAGTTSAATSALVSKDAFPSGAPVAYVASATSFSDGLAGGAAAGTQGGPMLLTGATTLPSVLDTELRRLNPAKIMVIGGTSSVSGTVAAQLAAIAPVERIGGANRYETAVLVSKRVFGTGRTATFIASGVTFPDALATVSPAGIRHAPVLLSTSTSLPTSARAELTRLSPSRVYIAGGTSAVGVGVAKTAQQLLGVCWSGTKMTAGTQQVITRFSGATKKVALTFDMGGRLVPARDIVAYLATNQVCTTFFIGGAMAQSTEGKQVMADIGKRPELFEVGNHTQHHCDLVLGGGGSPTAAPCTVAMTGTFIRSELTTAATVIRATSKLEPRPYWRPPYGSHNSFVRSNAAAVGYTKTIMWNRDTIDWSTATTTAQIVSRVTSPLPPDGSIVLMHLGGYRTLDALPQILSTLRANGYTLTSLSDLAHS